MVLTFTGLYLAMALFAFFVVAGLLSLAWQGRHGRRAPLQAERMGTWLVLRTPGQTTRAPGRVDAP